MGGNIDECPACRCGKPEFFAVGFHGASILSLSRYSLFYALDNTENMDYTLWNESFKVVSLQSTVNTRDDKRFFL